MSQEHADVVRESVAWMVAELIEAEVSAHLFQESLSAVLKGAVLVAAGWH